MNWINETFGTELSTNIQLGIMFVALLVALLVILWLFRRIFGSAGSRIARSRQPRLGVIEAAVVDDTRRLVLVRRDNVEHLLMIGGPGDVVIETRIEQNQPAQAAQATQPAKTQDHESPDMTPREPRLIEPVADSSPEVAAHQTRRREIAPASETATVAAATAATVSGVAASETVQAAEEVKAAAEEPVIETASAEAAAPAAEMAPQPANTASAVDELAQELTGGADKAAEETVMAADALEKDLREETEEDMQKLLDELADAKS